MKILLKVTFLILTMIWALATAVSIGTVLFIEEIETQKLILILSLVCFILWGICNYILNYIRHSY